MIFLHLESFENKHGLDFLIFQKPCFLVQPPKEGEFFCTVMIYFFSEFLLLSIYKELLEVSDYSVKEIQHEPTILNALSQIDFYKKYIHYYMLY